MQFEGLVDGLLGSEQVRYPLLKHETQGPDLQHSLKTWIWQPTNNPSIWEAEMESSQNANQSRLTENLGSERDLASIYKVENN